MKYEIEGKLIQIFDTKQVSDKFSKREFVLETEDGKYTQTILFESSGRTIEDLDQMRVGDKVNVHFNLRGRKWTNKSGEDKYFNSIHAWKLERVGEKQQTTVPAQGKGANPPADDPFGAPPPPPDDIPFLSSSMAHEPSPIAPVLRGRI